jgi:hypothetical protein
MNPIVKLIAISAAIIAGSDVRARAEFGGLGGCCINESYCVETDLFGCISAGGVFFEGVHCGIGYSCRIEFCTADVDSDRMVELDDLMAVFDSWGPCTDCWFDYCAADVNFDCTVNIDDVLEIINAWGACG